MKGLLIFGFIASVLGWVHAQSPEMKQYWKDCKTEMNLTSRTIKELHANGDWEKVYRLHACVWEHAEIINDGVIDKDKLHKSFKAQIVREMEIVDECYELVDEKGPTENWIVTSEFEVCVWMKSAAEKGQ